MPSINLVVETELSDTIRARQICSMFDVPPRKKCRLAWRGELPIEEKEWHVGLIVGPSGSGKSSIMRQAFGTEHEFQWDGKSMLDDFSEELSIEEITKACGAVGFNTIPAWLRPFHVLSNGEQFRADLARRLCELPDPVVVDEFTSVVDRQVAKIGSHAVQKWARRNQRKFVAVTCHYDVIEWLQPDWIFEPATMKFQWRSVQRRPILEGAIRKIPYSDWALFAPYHYLTSNLHRGAKCFGLFVEGVHHPVGFTATLHRPHPNAHDITGVSRTVVLPDWQGLGLSFILNEAVGSAYRGIGRRFHTYPAHPAFIRQFDKSNQWKMVKRPGFSGVNHGPNSSIQEWKHGSRPCAVFKYIGPVMNKPDAMRLIEADEAQITRTKRNVLRKRKPRLQRKR